MARSEDILKQAHDFFTQGLYDKALFLYSQILSLDPTNVEYQLYPILCDIASENDIKGQALFDYFTVTKSHNKENAVDELSEIISAYDGDNEKLMNLLKQFSTQNIEELNAINYEDFEDLVNQRGSFKVAFQDIMFSTKVAITSKEEFYKFVNQLIENDFIKTAYYYLDGFNDYFKYDEQIMGLYSKLESKPLDNNNKQ